ncbi:MAG: hypothetical protein MUC83_08325 [Pirellula sp.]|nr:hypothetical protein [Pirellula sp.]
MTIEADSQHTPPIRSSNVAPSRRQWVVMLALALAFSPPSIRLARDILGMPPAQSQCNCSVLCQPTN